MENNSVEDLEQRVRTGTNRAFTVHCYRAGAQSVPLQSPSLTSVAPQPRVQLTTGLYLMMSNSRGPRALRDRHRHSPEAGTLARAGLLLKGEGGVQPPV